MMRRLLSRCTTVLRDDSAATAAEFALVLPIFLGLIFSTINGSIMVSAAIQVHYAAERAARCLSVDVGGNCSVATIDAYAKKFYEGPGIAGLIFTPTAGLPCGNQVVGSGTYELVSGLNATSVSISASSCYPVI